MVRIRDFIEAYTLSPRLIWGGAVILLILPILLMVMQNDLPITSDAPLHLHRIMSAAINLQEGVYPRWTPYLHHGFGYPVHNFYSPAFYVLSATLVLLTPLTALATFKLMLMLGLLAYPVGMYLFARTMSHRAGALLASALYLYAPLRLREVWVQMNVPQWWAMALLPFVLWAIHRALQKEGGRWWVVAGGLFALVVVMHHLTAFLFAPFAGLYALLLVALRWHAEGRTTLIQSAGRIVGIFALGIGLSAFYWLPALGELDATQIDTIQDDAYSINANFIAFETLIAPTTAIDRSWLNWTDINGTYGARIGQAQLLVTLLGLLAVPFCWRVWDASKRAHILLSLAVIGILCWMMTPLSEPIWNTLPLIGYIQFPWRLLGILLLACAVLGALLVDSLSETLQSWITGALLIVSFVAILPMLYAPATSANLPIQPTPADAIEYERLSGNLGLSASNEYLPAGVEDRPLYGLFVRDTGNGSTRIERYNDDGWWLDIDENTLIPDGASVEPTDIQAGMRWGITTPEAFTMIVHQMDFVGWGAWLNGDVVPIISTTPHGLISILIPAGTHTLTIAYTGTPLQHGATLLTLASCLLMGIWGWRNTTQPSAPIPQPSRKNRLPVAVSAIIIGYSLAQMLWLMPATDFMRPMSNPDTPPADMTTFINFGDTLALVGYDMPTTARAGERITISLYWRALQTPELPFQSAIALVDLAGNVYANEGNYRIANLDTRTWDTTHYIIERYTFILPENTPPFHLQARLAVFNIAQDGTQNYLRAADGATDTLMHTLVVEGDMRRWDDDTLTPVDIRLQDEQQDAVRILGWAWQTNPTGDTCLAVRWQAERDALGEYAVLLHWRSATDETLSVHDTAPFDNAHPTQHWQAGQRLDDRYCLPIPDGAESLLLGLYRRADGVRLRARVADGFLPEDVLRLEAP